MMMHMDRLQQLSSALAGLGVGMEQSTSGVAHAAACWAAVVGMLALAFLRAATASERATFRARVERVLRKSRAGTTYVGAEV